MDLKNTEPWEGESLEECEVVTAARSMPHGMSLVICYRLPMLLALRPAGGSEENHQTPEWHANTRMKT